MNRPQVPVCCNGHLGNVAETAPRPHRYEQLLGVARERLFSSAASNTGIHTYAMPLHSFAVVARGRRCGRPAGFGVRPPASPRVIHSRRPLKSPPRASWREVFGRRPANSLFGQIMPSAGRFGLRGLFLRLRGRAVVGGILRGEGLRSRRRVDSMRQLPAVLQLKREVALPPYAQKRG